MSVIVDEVMLREPNLLVPGKKPVGPVKIDWSHPMTDGLSAYFCPLPNNNARDLVNGYMPSKLIGDGWQATHDGIGWRTSADGHVIEYPGHDGQSIKDDFTVFYRGYIYGRVAGNMYLYSTRALTYSWNNNWGVYITTANWLQLIRYGDTSIFAGTSNFPGIYPSLYNINISGIADTDFDLLINGVKTSDTSSTSTQSSNDTVLRIHNNDTNLADALDGIFMCLGIWQRALSDAEKLSLEIDPYQFLIPA